MYNRHRSFFSRSNSNVGNTTGKMSLQADFDAQLERNNVLEKKSKRKPGRKVDADSESDEDLKEELKQIVDIYKKNKKREEPPPQIKSSNLGNVRPPNNNVNARVKGKEKNLANGKKNGSGDAASDIMELVNYFFGPEKVQNSSRNVKSYSDYEKQGAIPKRRSKNGSKTLELLAGFNSTQNRETELSESMRHEQGWNSDGEVEKVSEETSRRPFFYIVPENPCPKFFLPRGSYYITPKVPGSLSEDDIVFHPERGSDSKTIRRNKKNNFRSLVQNSEMNDLSKEASPKTDSHLNIGPSDVKTGDFSNNLSSNYSPSKIYEHKYIRTKSENSSPPSLAELFVEYAESDGVEDTSIFDVSVSERLGDIIQQLLSEIPGMTLERAQSLAGRYLNDEPGLESFLASEHLKLRIEAQVERLVMALPDSDPVELLQKCNEFKGDETLLNVYIQEVQRENGVRRRVLDLQYIFPDADPEFLRRNVEAINDGDDVALVRFTEELLESQEYPRMADDSQSSERKRLWTKYVSNFNVKNYLRDTRNMKDIYDPSRSNKKEHTDLVYKYLTAKYPFTPDDYLRDHFYTHNNDLIKTCESLNLNEQVGLWESSIQNEAYTESFLKEICYIEHKKEIDKHLKEISELKEIEIEEARVNNWFLTCPLCTDDELVASEAVTCPEGHVFCTECIKTYVSTKLGDGVYKFVCPLEQCETFFTLSALENLLSETTFLNITKKQQAEEISCADVEGLESCPYCEFAYIPNPEDKIFKCQNSACLIETCRKCRDKNHIPLRCEEIERPVDLEARKKIEEVMTQKLVRVCPKCGKKIVRIDGCNKMVCTCGAFFCYVCRSSITGYDHFGNNRCPLRTNNEDLHLTAVRQAGIAARDEIIRENPNIRFLHDPTV